MIFKKKVIVTLYKLIFLKKNKKTLRMLFVKNHLESQFHQRQLLN